MFKKERLYPYNNLLTIRMATCGLAFVQSTILLDGLMLGHKRRSRGAPVAKRKSWGQFPFLPGSSFPRLINLFSDIGINFTLRLNRVNCLAKMRVPTGLEVHLTDGLLAQLNFDNDDKGGLIAAPM